MNLDLMQAFFAWLAGAAGAYAAVEVRIRWLTSNQATTAARVEKLEDRLTKHIVEDHHGSPASP